MARQFEGRLTADALREALAGPLTDAYAAAIAPAAEATAGAEDAVAGTDEALVVDWLGRLYLLNGVPFHYLVPDAGMLPPESIRFFQVDDAWVQALVDGAFSLGSAGAARAAGARGRAALGAAAAATAAAGARRQALLAGAAPRSMPPTAAPAPAPTAGPAPAPASADASTAPVRDVSTVPVPDASTAPVADAAGTPGVLSGFLLRSAVVAGWPGLEVHGFGDTAGARPLAVVRMEALAPTLLMVLFAGGVQRVDLREPGEAVHFGVSAAGSGWQKPLRYAAAGQDVAPGDAVPVPAVPVPLRGAEASAVVSLAALAEAMDGRVWPAPPPAGTRFTAAEFALQMVEGAQAVSFQLQTS